MSIKSTRHITRDEAIGLLIQEVMSASNETLADLLDRISDSGSAKHVSYFDNFRVS